MAREYFCAYHSYLESMSELSDEECGRLFRACLEYSAGGTVPPFSGNEKFVFPAMKSQIDRDKKKYDEKCAQNRKNRNGVGDRQRPSSIVNDRGQGEEKDKEKGERKGDKFQFVKEKQCENNHIGTDL